MLRGTKNLFFSTICHETWGILPYVAITKKQFVFEPFGLLRDVVPPFPIPNRDVKHISADNSRLSRVCEDTSRPEDSKTI